MRYPSLLAAILVSTLAWGQDALPKDRHDAPFPQEIPTHFRESDGLPSANALTVAVLPDGGVLASTDAGLAAFDGEAWSPVDSPDFTVRHILAFGDTVWLGGSGLGRYTLSSGAWLEVRLSAGEEVTALALSSDGAMLAVGTTTGVAMYEGIERAAFYATESPVRGIVLDGEQSAVATDAGLFLGRPSDTFFADAQVYPADERYSWAPMEVRGLAKTGDAIWFGCRNGAGVWTDAGWSLFTGSEGLPYGNFTCAEPGESHGVIWFGTERGAIRYDGVSWAYRASLRWLADDRVNAIAVAPDGTAWIATPKGVSRIERRMMTLDEKAEYYVEVADERHTRMGYVARTVLEAPGDLTRTKVIPTPNDGSYIGVFGAAQSFRYAVTKDADAKRRADAAFDRVKLLFDATGIKGFPARAVVSADGPDPNANFGESYNLERMKEDPQWKNILPRWPKSADGKYYWYCDTSSDETAGLYFFLAVYYDLATETDEEKAAVRQVVHDMTSHIVDNGWRLIDHDGKPTRWANWSPEYCNGPGWSDRGLQAMQMLSYLNVAHHVTGDQKFLDAAKYLRDEHDYHVMAMNSRSKYPPTSYVPWDDNLAFQSHYGLIRYEKDPELRARYAKALDQDWLFVSQKRDAYYNIAYAALMPEDQAEDAAVMRAEKAKALTDAYRTLRGLPLDLIRFDMANSHRLDVTMDTRARQDAGIGWLRNGDALPIEERPHIRISADAFLIDGGQGGLIEYEGSIFLLPYYMGRYYGFIE